MYYNLIETKQLTTLRNNTMSKYDGIYSTIIESEKGLFELKSVTAVNNTSLPAEGDEAPFINGHRFELEVYRGDYKGIYLVACPKQVETMIETLRSESTAGGSAFNADQISSIGWLNNHDGSICLTICLRHQGQPIFVTISKNEYAAAGGCEGLNNDKSQAVVFHSKYGPGRP